METAQARSIYIPKLGGTLRFGTIRQPASLTAAEGSSISEHERLLAEAVRFITAFPAGHTMTYTRWKEITGAIENSMNKAAFVDELRISIAGDDKNKQEMFDRTLVDIRALLGEYIARVPDVSTYAALLIRNIVLSGGLTNDTRLGTLFGLSGYAGYDGTSLIRSLHHDLSRWDEITLSLWASVASATQNERILPSVKSTFEELLVFEIPFSGSPRIISMSAAEAMSRARGCALFVLSAAAIRSGAVFATGAEPYVAISIAVEGVACALVFVGFGAILPLLEEALARGFGRIFNEKE